MHFLAFCIFCLAFQEYTAAEPFVTRLTLALDAWATAEIKFLEKLLEFLSTVELVEKTASNALRKYLYDFRESSGNIVGDLRNQNVLRTHVDAIISNPLATYRMIHRITHQLAQVRTHFQVLNSGLFNHFPSTKWLTKQDLEDAMMGILRICHVYNIPLEAISNGVILDLDTGIKLNDIHCYEIGCFAKSQKMFALSVQLLEIALQKPRASNITKKHMQTELRDSILLHDQEFENSKGVSVQYLFTQKISQLKNFHGNSYKKHRKIQRSALAEDQDSKRTNPNEEENEDLDQNNIQYWTLCTQGTILDEVVKADLYCWYEKQNPYFRVGPLKMELLAHTPDVVQIYDVIGEKKISLLKEIASGTLNPSLVSVEKNVNSSSGKKTYVQDSSRTSVNSWVNDLEVLPDLARTIEIITGLKATSKSSTEPLQIVSYSTTAHYDGHTDYFGNDGTQDYIKKGDRLATFLIYLQEPRLGGSTVFPQLGIASKPVLGSAVFWYNLYRDGTGDGMSSHGSCPVMYGRKWVANKWIRYNDQFLTRKCGLTGDDKFNIVPSLYD